MLQPLNDWIGFLFAMENVDRTVAALPASQGGVGGTSDAREGIKARLTKAEVRLRRLQAAIEAGVDPAAVVEGINEAQAERAAAKAELENTSVPDVLQSCTRRWTRRQTLDLAVFRAASVTSSTRGRGCGDAACEGCPVRLVFMTPPEPWPPCR